MSAHVPDVAAETGAGRLLGKKSRMASRMTMMVKRALAYDSRWDGR